MKALKITGFRRSHGSPQANPSIPEEFFSSIKIKPIDEESERVAQEKIS
ncbi:hypothetical protein [Carnobacterium viridans]|nr:hypothetical protein [Carnobacterium viridans]